MTIELDPCLGHEDQKVVEALLTLLGTREPSLEQIWACMDFIWQSQGCDNHDIRPDKLDAYYRHPVWLLNGLFIEQHEASLSNRDVFSDWVASRSPARVADIGGGFGTLARAVARKCPQSRVEVIEPHAHQYAVSLAAEYPGLSYAGELSGEYDVMIATDVFEHVVDPLALLEQTAAHLAPGGRYLIANCFYPVIKCHLPCTFHFRHTWKWVLGKMNLKPIEEIGYGTVFEKTGPVDATLARSRERISRMMFRLATGDLAILRKLKHLLIRVARSLSAAIPGKR